MAKSPITVHENQLVLTPDVEVPETFRLTREEVEDAAHQLNLQVVNCDSMAAQRAIGQHVASLGVMPVSRGFLVQGLDSMQVLLKAVVDATEGARDNPELLVKLAGAGAKLGDKIKGLGEAIQASAPSIPIQADAPKVVLPSARQVIAKPEDKTR